MPAASLTVSPATPMIPLNDIPWQGPSDAPHRCDPGDFKFSFSNNVNMNYGYRTRRSRFTAFLRTPGSTEIEKRVILSYDAPSVKWHYERSGYEVISVEKGDYRKTLEAKPRTGA